MSTQSPTLHPQTILLVGGGQGIGLSILQSILVLSPTARILVFGRHLDAELQTLWSKHYSRISIIKGDVTSPADRLKAVEVCVTEWGGVDTLVYGAGIMAPVECIEKVDLEELRRAWEVNVMGAVAMSQLCIPHLRKSSLSPSASTNTAYGKVLILSSACDDTVTYRGWMPYCTTKAALTRFVSALAHEERHLTVQGVYPKLTRTKMAEDIISGKYNGVMADHEIERFRVWNEIGDTMVEPAEWCGDAVAKLAVGLHAGGPSGKTLYYEEHVPSKVVGT